MDFSVQELVNDLAVSCASAAAERLLGAGPAGVPQILSSGATGMGDVAARTCCPGRLCGRAALHRNHLSAEVCVDHEIRRRAVRTISDRLSEVSRTTCPLLPTDGVGQWGRPDDALHDPEGIKDFVGSMCHVDGPNTVFEPMDAHVKDEALVQAALLVFDAMVAGGLESPGVEGPVPSEKAA